MNPTPGGACGGVPEDRMYETAGQLERTALSWNRTLLALAVNGTLLVRMGTGGAAAAWVAGVGGLVLAVTMLAWFTTSRAYRRLRGRPARSLLARPSYAAGAALCVGLVGMADLVAIAVYS